MKQYNNWEEIDKDTDGLVTSLTYIVLFVNDQVYNYALNIYDSCRNTPYYRRGVKKNINELKRFMESYNTNICRIANVNVETLAVITQSMEDDIKPHIDRYGFAISQTLLNNGCSGELNHLISIASTIDMLCQTSKITIRDFYISMRKLVPIAVNPLAWLSIDKAMFYARMITDNLTPKDVSINLNDIPAISTAFQAISNKMLSPDVFEKAFNECLTR